MAEQTSIEWTDATWNPTSGCTKVSPGCLHCYIERTPPMRMAGRKFVKGHIPLELHPDRLEAPLHWRKPRRIFVNSMSDLFHEDVPDEFIVRCFAVMLLTQRHTYQVLTKRPDRMLRVVRAPNFGECVYDMAFNLSHQWCRGGLMDAVPKTDVLPNVWLGVSVENRRHGLPRIDVLRKVPAAVRFLSAEPLLEDLGQIDLTGIGWVIAGGENGPGARPCRLNWLRAVVAQGRAAGVPVFVKQLGSRPENDAGFSISWRLRDRKGGDPAEWPEDLRVREFPERAGP